MLSPVACSNTASLVYFPLRQLPFPVLLTPSTASTLCRRGLSHYDAISSSLPLARTSAALFPSSARMSLPAAASVVCSCLAQFAVGCLGEVGIAWAKKLDGKMLTGIADSASASFAGAGPAPVPGSPFPARQTTPYSPQLPLLLCLFPFFILHLSSALTPYNLSP